MRPRSLVAVMLGLLLVVVSGCGIPDETGVHVEGAGPARGEGSEGRPVREPRKRADTSDDEKEFVADYLAAAAGEIGGAYERVKNYVVPDQRGDLREPQGQDHLGVNVVRLTESIFNHGQDNTIAVTLKVQQVGVLRPNGAVDPPDLTDTSYTLLIKKLNDNDIAGRSHKGSLWVMKPPPVLLMSEQALEEYYEERTIYFWNKERTDLVPDLRHLPKAVSESRRADEIVGWLTWGPAGWLMDAVASLPAGTQKIGNVTQDEGRLVVNLATEIGTDQGVAQLGTQLAWSLRQENVAELELKIKDERRAVIDTADRRGSDWTYRIASDPPARFCVYAGVVYRLKDSDDTGRESDGTSGSVPIAASANRNVVAAAFSYEFGGRNVWAALVAKTGDERRLLVGSGVDVVNNFEQSQPFARMSRPIWVKSHRSKDPVGLIVADGKLYQFGRGASLTPVNLSGGQKIVTAVAAGLDGHRIAYVADGALYVAALTVTDHMVKVHPVRPLRTLLGDLTAVEWVGENRLVMAGVAGDGQAALRYIDDDGTRETSRWNWGQLGTAKIMHLAAYPENPVHRDLGHQVLYELNEVAWDGVTGERLEGEHVKGLPDSPKSAGQAPTAPFFVY